jgi:hypothetical protein
VAVVVELSELEVVHPAVVVAVQLEIHMVETQVRVIKVIQEELERQEMVVAAVEVL